MNNFKNNHRRNRFRSNSDRNFKKRNGNGHKLNSDFNNNSEFKRKNPGRNNQNAAKLVDKYNASIDGEIYLKVSGTYVGGSENTIRARDIDVIEPSKMIENLDISPLRISVDEEKLDKKNLVLLKELLEKFPGLSSVELEVNSKSGSKLLELKEIKVKKTNQLKNEISTLLAK